ncbi:MAG: TrkA family potassium uptake protein [Ignavibacteriaceae bacterium]
MKHYAIIGLGNFGYNLALKLIDLGNEVLVIDNDEQKINKIKSRLTDAIIGDAKDKNILSDLFNANIDAAIISVGENLEASILAVHHLKELGVKRIIAKSISDEHEQLLKIVGADEIISPEKDMANLLGLKLSSTNLLEHIPLTSEFSIIEAAVPDSFIGKTLKELKLRNKYGILVIAVKKILTDEFVLMPESDFKFEPDFLLIIMGTKKNIEAFRV